MIERFKVTSKENEENEEARVFYFKGCNWSIESPIV